MLPWCGMWPGIGRDGVREFFESKGWTIPRWFQTGIPYEDNEP
jgi:hypothetical protein